MTPLTIETFESSADASTTTRGLPFVAQRIDQRAELRAVESVDLRGENLDALDVARLRFQVAGLRLGQLGLELLELVLERFLARQQLLDCRQLRLEACALRCVQCACVLEALQRAFAGDGFDAAHAGRDAALVDDLADADIAGAADVRAAAELLAEGVDLHDAHLVAVLFAEQRHGAGLRGLVEIHDVGVDLAVGEDLLVHQPLDFGELVRDPCAV